MPCLFKKLFIRFIFMSGLSLLFLIVGAMALAASEFTFPVRRATGGGQIMTGGSYTVVGVVGQPDAGQLSGGSLRVNGGVIGEAVVTPQDPILAPRAYLPITWQSYPQWLMLDEEEPNNLFNQANLIPSLPALVSGSHDGAAGGGDVFSLSLEAGRILDVSLFTEDASGVQLLAYDAAGVEVTRDYSDPFRLAFTTSYSGTFYVYVFSDPEAGNTGSYTLTIRAGDPLPGLDASVAPTMDAEHMNQPPHVELTP